MNEPYRQFLPDLDLSIEHNTDAVPTDGAWYLMQSGSTLGKFRSLKAARKAWNRTIAESDWTPSQPKIDPELVLLKEKKERWARNRSG
jgi:hypothetical protein